MLFYVFVYTIWLKPRSPQNIVIGGAAGAVPVLVGWAAVTDTLAAPAWVMFAIVFFWTPPHFWALSLRYRDDYAAAGIPMLPVVQRRRRRARQILVYTLVVVAVDARRSCRLRDDAASCTSSPRSCSACCSSAGAFGLSRDATRRRAMRAASPSRTPTSRCSSPPLPSTRSSAPPADDRAAAPRLAPASSSASSPSGWSPVCCVAVLGDGSDSGGTTRPGSVSGAGGEVGSPALRASGSLRSTGTATSASPTIAAGP